MAKKTRDIQSILDEAMEKASTEKRASYLDKACGGDVSLRQEAASHSITGWSWTQPGASTCWTPLRGKSVAGACRRSGARGASFCPDLVRREIVSQVAIENRAGEHQQASSRLTDRVTDKMNRRTESERFFVWQGRRSRRCEEHRRCSLTQSRGRISRLNAESFC